MKPIESKEQEFATLVNHVNNVTKSISEVRRELKSLISDYQFNYYDSRLQNMINICKEDKGYNYFNDIHTKRMSEEFFTKEDDFKVYVITTPFGYLAYCFHNLDAADAYIKSICLKDYSIDIMITTWERVANYYPKTGALLIPNITSDDIN